MQSDIRYATRDTITLFPADSGEYPDVEYYGIKFGSQFLGLLFRQPDGWQPFNGAGRAPTMPTLRAAIESLCTLTGPVEYSN